MKNKNARSFPLKQYWTGKHPKIGVTTNKMTNFKQSLFALQVNTPGIRDNRGGGQIGLFIYTLVPIVLK